MHGRGRGRGGGPMPFPHRGASPSEDARANSKTMRSIFGKAGEVSRVHQ